MARLALAYLFRRPVQLLAVLGVAAGLLALLVVLSVMNGLIDLNRASIRAPLSDLLLIPAVAEQDTPEWRTYREALESAPEVEAVAPHLVAYAVLSIPGVSAAALSSSIGADMNGVQVVGIDPEAEARVTAFGASLRDARVAPVDDPARPFAVPPGPFQRPGALLSDALARGLPLGPGERLQGGKQIELGALPARLPPPGEELVPHNARFTVAGTYAPSDYRMSLDRIYVQRSGRDGLHYNLLGSDAPDFTEALIRLAPGVSVPQGKQAVRDALARAGLPAPGGARGGSLQSWEERAGVFLAAIENERRVIALVMFFIVVVAAFGLFATLSALVREKVRDLGVLAALGYTPARRGLLLFAVGGAGAALGAALGHGGARALVANRKPITDWLRDRLGFEVFSSELYVVEGLPATWDPAQAWTLTAAAFAVGLAFTAAPALRAALLSPVQSLRYE